MEKNSKSKVDNLNFFQINGWMVNELKLSGNILMVYAIIYGFSQDGESYFTGSRKYLCDFTGASKPTIDKALEELLCMGLIIKESEKKNDIVYNRFKVNKEKLDFTTSKESLPLCKETLPNNIEYSIDENNKENSSIINNTKEKTKKPEEIIYDYYYEQAIKFEYAKRKSEPNNITLTHIKKYLTSYSVDEIKKTIDRYYEVINDKTYFFNTYWSAEKFFKQGNTFNDFLEEGSKWINYKLFKEKQKSYNPYKREEISRETKYPEIDDRGYIY